MTCTHLSWLNWLPFSGSEETKYSAIIITIVHFYTCGVTWVIKLIIRAFSRRDYSSGRERIKVWWILMNQIRRLGLFNDNVWRWWTAASLGELGAFTVFPISFSCKASHSDPTISLNPESDQGSVWPQAFSLLQSSSELLRYSCCVVAHLCALLNKKCRVGGFFSLKKLLFYLFWDTFSKCAEVCGAELRLSRSAVCSEHIKMLLRSSE